MKFNTKDEVFQQECELVEQWLDEIEFITGEKLITTTVPHIKHDRIVLVSANTIASETLFAFAYPLDLGCSLPIKRFYVYVGSPKALYDLSPVKDLKTLQEYLSQRATPKILEMIQEQQQDI